MDIKKILGEESETDDRADKKLWYAITTFSTHEHKVLDDLVRKLITNQQHGDIVDACFIAEKEVTETVTDAKGRTKTKTTSKNMTPGYIYIKMKMTDEAWFTIRNTPSVSGFVGSHGKKSKPVPISDNEMIPVLKYCGRMDLLGKMEAPYKKGDSVQVLSGPFAGKHGTVETLSADNTMAKVNIIMLGQTVPVEIDVDDIANYKR